ncbi:MAG TPA: GGDEF domain-containing protein [Rhodanobacteraceae bacterium]
MTFQNTPSPATDHFRRRVLLVVMATALLATLFAWYAELAGGTSTPVWFAVQAVTTAVLSTLLLITWFRVLPQRVVELGCLLCIVGVCAACMAFDLYLYTRNAAVYIEPLYLWIPLVYVFAFMLVSHKAGLILSLAIFALFLGVSVPYLVHNMHGRYVNFTVQLHVASAIMIAMLYFFTSYQHRLRLAEAAAGRFADLSNTDDLTGLANRRRVVSEINAALARFAWGAGGFAVLLFDVDHFKTVNDQFGHGIGDAVLKALAERAAAVLGDSGVLGRWGGDEFVAALRGIDAGQAVQLATALCVRVTGTPLVGGQNIAVSCGVTVARRGDSVDSVLQRADAALYAAKRAGRNRVESLVEPDYDGPIDAMSGAAGAIDDACLERASCGARADTPDAAAGGVRRCVRR